jgi:hypothetical protein
MDIVIKYILEYMDSEKEDFIKEWETGQYTKISDCPTYPYIKAYCDAITVLNRMDGNYSGITPTSFVSHI